MTDVKTIKILLIEDNSSAAELVQMSLKNSKTINFKVNWVETLNDAKTQLIRNQFDILLLDLLLPDSAGINTLQKALTFAVETPIIILTGENDTEFALNALKIGATDYLVKGDFSPDSLIRSIRYSLQRAEMEKSHRLLVAALEATANGIVITDYEGVIKWANSAFTKLSGYDLDEAIGHKPAELIKSGVQNQSYYEQMWTSLLAGKPWRGEIVNKRKDGRLYYEELNIAPVLNKAGVIEHFIGIKEDISVRKKMEAKLQNLANTDPLTELFNRRVFLDKLQEETARLKRFHQHFASLLMLDLDFFKQVNDNYGHAAGDKVLCHFANILTETLRSIDFAARLGGEEFAVLLPGTDKEGALVIAERLRLKVAEMSVEYLEHKVKITVSIGVAELSKNDPNYEAALHKADSALYQAKSQGRNQCCLFISSIDDN